MVLLSVSQKGRGRSRRRRAIFPPSQSAVHRMPRQPNVVPQSRNSWSLGATQAQALSQSTIVPPLASRKARGRNRRRRAILLPSPSVIRQRPCHSENVPQCSKARMSRPMSARTQTSQMRSRPSHRRVLEPSLPQAASHQRDRHQALAASAPWVVRKRSSRTRVRVACAQVWTRSTIMLLQAGRRARGRSRRRRATFSPNLSVIRQLPCQSEAVPQFSKARMSRPMSARTQSSQMRSSPSPRRVLVPRLTPAASRKRGRRHLLAAPAPRVARKRSSRRRIVKAAA
mmetsp:Transcript_73496/g.224790  ORF Transcript_73496/g.224790 Transcript_73496/m.224790 type:complete len:285 (+) Transcript_73496:212-1066(+)